MTIVQFESQHQCFAQRFFFASFNFGWHAKKKKLIRCTEAMRGKCVLCHWAKSVWGNALAKYINKYKRLPPLRCKEDNISGGSSNDLGYLNE